ncbi:MAG: UDP-N-acetylmuramoyl-L-alanine--D-glutamate ligase [Candidatus Peribacteraceae bacterium]|jgi:UDP-N-acetylmuramoylalanine--D-glutamate ligase
MNIRDLNGKNVCILGYGKEGQATLRALEKYAPTCEITIADRDESIPKPVHKHWLQLGTGWLENLGKFDVLIKSPGIPPSVIVSAFQQPTTNNKQPANELTSQRANQLTTTSATQIFLDSIKDSGATVIGVTGSKGKSTTASLIHAILKAAGKNSFLLGNIGSPALDALESAAKDTFFVLEMSSYQLMDLTRSPHIAVITSFFPEHLDYHGTLQNYLEAKKHITSFQTRGDIVFFSADSEGARSIAQQSSGRRIPFSAEDAPVTLEETKLIGRHNLRNIAAAFLVSQDFKIPKDIAIEAIKSFQPLPHRLQSLGVIDGFEWIDDSISTTPESAIAALDALGDRVETIFLGGQDRGYDFSELGKHLARSSVKTVILFPGSGPEIRKAIKSVKSAATIHEVSTMEEAVGLATQAPNPKSQIPIVLLSPASPSYGMFKNFEERGDQFRSCIFTK